MIVSLCPLCMMYDFCWLVCLCAVMFVVICVCVLCVCRVIVVPWCCVLHVCLFVVWGFFLYLFAVVVMFAFCSCV